MANLQELTSALPSLQFSPSLAVTVISIRVMQLCYI